MSNNEDARIILGQEFDKNENDNDDDVGASNSSSEQVQEEREEENDDLFSVGSFEDHLASIPSSWFDDADDNTNVAVQKDRRQHDGVDIYTNFCPDFVDNSDRLEERVGDCDPGLVRSGSPRASFDGDRGALAVHTFDFERNLGQHVHSMPPPAGQPPTKHRTSVAIMPGCSSSSSKDNGQCNTTASSSSNNNNDDDKNRRSTSTTDTGNKAQLKRNKCSSTVLDESPATEEHENKDKEGEEEHLRHLRRRKAVAKRNKQGGQSVSRSPERDSDVTVESEKPKSSFAGASATSSMTFDNFENDTYTLGSGSGGAGENNSDDFDPYYHSSLMKKLVTHKDLVTETFLKDVIDSLPHRSDLSAPELSRLWKDEARKRITKYSVTLSHKLGPLVQIMLEQKLSASLESTFAEVATTQPNEYDMVCRYERCFNKWVDDSKCVSFKATNTRLLGRTDVKDMFILTFFAFCTCRRTKNDNILQLGVVGCSTSGKSTLFEACLMEGSHVTTNEKGVGRFQAGNKPVLLFHDVEIRTLVMSKDTEKIKTIARTEPTVTKVHGTTYTLQPLFLFYSSNERMMTHKFSDSLPNQPFQWRMYHGQVNEMSGYSGGSGGSRKRVTEENLSALQNRFIECFVRKPPKLDPNDLPQSGGFQRMHGILGMYTRIVETLQRYKPSDFFSPVLPQYVLHGLCMNFKARAAILSVSAQGSYIEPSSVSASASFSAVAAQNEDTKILPVVMRLEHEIRELVHKYIAPPLQSSLLQHL